MLGVNPSDTLMNSREYTNRKPQHLTQEGFHSSLNTSLHFFHLSSSDDSCQTETMRTEYNDAGLMQLCIQFHSHILSGVCNFYWRRFNIAEPN